MGSVLAGGADLTVLADKLLHLNKCLLKLHEGHLEECDTEGLKTYRTDRINKNN